MQQQTPHARSRILVIVVLMCHVARVRGGVGEWRDVTSARAVRTPGRHKAATMMLKLCRQRRTA